jgi:hypothetical protein
MSLSQFSQSGKIIELWRRTQSIYLFKCASQEFIMRFLRFLNNTHDGEKPPESWLKAISSSA